jgi:hypothetical protein
VEQPTYRDDSVEARLYERRKEIYNSKMESDRALSARRILITRFASSARERNPLRPLISPRLPVGEEKIKGKRTDCI